MDRADFESSFLRGVARACWNRPDAVAHHAVHFWFEQPVDRWLTARRTMREAVKAAG